MGLQGKVTGGFRGNLRKASRLGFEGGFRGLAGGLTGGFGVPEIVFPDTAPGPLMTREEC